MSKRKDKSKPKQRNPMALALQSNLFRQRVTPNGKVYKRRDKHQRSEKGALSALSYVCKPAMIALR